LNIRITAGSARVTHTLRQHVEQRLEIALGRYNSRIRSVTVSFAAQGPKLKVCRIAVSLRRDVSVEAAGTDMFLAADLATDHLTRRVARAVETETAALAERATRSANARRVSRR
jgi:ribosomal subunit interface protein